MLFIPKQQKDKSIPHASPLPHFWFLLGALVGINMPHWEFKVWLFVPCRKMVLLTVVLGDLAGEGPWSRDEKDQV